MIIIDLQQVLLANLHMQLKGHTNAQLDESMLRHMSLNSIRAYNFKFRKDYGELVIACDARHTWRRDIFPYYKIRRKAARAKSELDWTTIFQALGNIRSELKEFFPYRVIEVDNAEADDIIGTLAHRFGITDQFGFGEVVPVLIVSGDKDFKQLLRYENVKIFDPIKKIEVKLDNPDDFQMELIMRGDPGDDVPNIMSQDDSFASGTRQKQLRETKIEELKATPFANWPEHVQRNFFRNKKLIDLWDIPQEVQDAINSEYDAEGGKGRMKIFNYLMDKELTQLIMSVSEF